MIKALVAGKKRFVKPEVPFSDVSGLVLGREGLGNGNFRAVHPVGVGWAEKLAVLAPDVFGRIFFGCPHVPPLEEGAYPIGHPEAVRITTGLHCRTGGRAYRTGGISIGKKYSLLGQPVHIRSPVKI